MHIKITEMINSTFAKLESNENFTKVLPSLHLACPLPQETFASYNKKPHKAVSAPFVFKGLITCNNCGCIITPEIKKKIYIYYSCSNAKGNCQRQYVVGPEKILGYRGAILFLLLHFLLLTRP